MKGITKGNDLYTSILSIPLMIIFGGLEELGWRYILQKQLQKRFYLEVATSITAIVWAIWHLPLFFIYGTAQNNLSFILFTIMVFGMSFALTSIYYISNSIWLCILFHSSINALSSTWIIKDNLEIKTCTSLAIIILSFTFINKPLLTYIDAEK